MFTIFIGYSMVIVMMMCQLMDEPKINVLIVQNHKTFEVSIYKLILYI